jgi:glycosyltransferase involved in cell wall biosynthesis
MKEAEADLVKVAQIEPVGGHGGMNYYDFGLCQALCESGHRVWLFTSAETKPIENASFRLVPAFRNIYGRDSSAIRALRFLRGLVASLRQARAEGCRIVHLHIFHSDLRECITTVLAKRFGFRVVATVHDVESFTGHRLSGLSRRALYASVDHLIVHNNVSKTELVSFAGADEDKISIVHHGNYVTGAQLPSRDEACAKLGLDPSRQWLLFFGQIKRVKGLDLLLESLAAVRNANPNVGLVIAGKVWRDSFSEYQNIISANKLEPSIVQHIHYIPDEIAPNYYAASSLIILPYRRIYQSGVLLMAMSYGRASVVSDLPGMLEVVSDEHDAFVFRSGDSASLAATIIKALRDETVLASVARAALDTANQRYSWRRAGELTSAVYRTLVRRERDAEG